MHIEILHSKQEDTLYTKAFLHAYVDVKFSFSLGEGVGFC